MRIDVETNEEQGSGSGLGLRLSNDRIPVHLGDVLLGYARFRLDGHLQMINAPDDEERARSQAALANRGWIEEKAEAPAIRILVTQAEPGVGYAVDRDALGRLVRDEWLAWAREQPEPKASWLQTWDELSEPEREVDRRIGERLHAEGAGFHQLAVETLEAAAGKTIPSERAAGLIRYHLQNADIAQSDRGELAAAADLLDTLQAAGATVPSYHDLHITTDKIPRTSIFDLPYGIEVKCNRVAGWEVWDSSSGKVWRLLGGEFDAEPEDNEEGRPVRGGLRLDVAGFVIVDSLGKEASDG